MKRMLMLVGLTGAMAVAGATPAMAINKEWSAALGFLGGVMATRTYDYRHGNYGGGCGRGQQVVVQQAYYPQPVVVQSYAPPPVYVQQPVYVQPPVGHYEILEEQQWVPGTWKYEQLDCNTYRKVWCEGYYRTVQTRVWVQEGGCR